MDETKKHESAPGPAAGSAGEAPAVPPPKSSKKEKGGSRKASKASGGDSRTLFRVAYRTQLDLTQLADNKASIMISVNGFILTIILASGSFVLDTEPELIPPFALLLLTCLASLTYAVLSARPRESRSKAGDERAREERSNLLFFEDFDRLSEDDYAAAMLELVGSSKRTNEEMARHIYHLGRVLAEKFRLLRISYNVFITGLTLSTLVFLGLAVADAWSDRESRLRIAKTSDLRFFDLYEPSGVVQLPDGRILVAQDEAATPFTLLSFDPDHSLSSPGIDIRAEVTLDDVEGLALDGSGFVYATTSHSRTQKGRSQRKRERLVRFRIEGERITDLGVVEDLEAVLLASLPETPAKAGGSRRPGLNIEGLAWDPMQERLLLGLRSPLVDRRAVVLPLANTREVFEEGEAPRFAPPNLLDLGGEGIRGMTWDDRLDAYLVLSGPVGSPTRPFGLWLWDGDGDSAPDRISSRDLGTLDRTEGIAPIRWDGKPLVLAVNDNGRRASWKPASYLLLDYESLEAARGKLEAVTP